MEYELFKNKVIGLFINKLTIPIPSKYSNDMTVRLGKEGCLFLVEKLREAGFIK